MPRDHAEITEPDHPEKTSTVIEGVVQFLDQGTWHTSFRVGDVFLTDRRHQIFDIPEPKPEVIEYHRRCIRCSCGAENWGKLPLQALMS